MYYIILIAVIIVLFLLWMGAKRRGQGITNFTQEQAETKLKNKQKILDLFAVNPELTNEEIREALKISARSVVNYMDELEKEGKVTQAGRTGRGVVYRLKF